MFEPTLALQTAIRTALVASSEVTALVPAEHIRGGSTRPDKTPAILMSDGHAALDGYNYRSQRTAFVYMDLHIWTLGAGQDAAKQIAGVVMSALDKPLVFEGCDCDQFRIPTSRFPRDPDPSYGHGILSVEAFVRWII